MGLLKTVLPLVLLMAFLPLKAQDEDYEYERSSLHTMMIKHLNHDFGDVIEDVYLSTPFPQRFNEHNLGVRVVNFAEIEDDQQYNIEVFIKEVNLGQKMVAKWFDRDKETGSFDMDLVKKRGYYNATQSQRNVARADMKGLSLLEDAGELLIKRTFLVVNDIDYVSKTGSKVHKKIKSSLRKDARKNTFKGSPFKLFSIKKTIKDADDWANDWMKNNKELLDEQNKIGGFNVEITSYLFRLDWDDEKANEFYVRYYTEDGAAEKDKVEAFKKENDLFGMTYVGKTTSESEEVESMSVENPKALMVKVCTRALDKNIAQLQHAHPDFRIKAPLISVEPLTAHVGLKEDITEDSRFEVLERVIDQDGKLSYKRVGVIKPEKGKIWDNRYEAEEDGGEDANLQFTTFRKVSGGDFYPGMLIRETD